MSRKKNSLRASSRFCMSDVGISRLLFVVFCMAFFMLVVASFLLDWLFAYPICEICMLQRLIMLGIAVFSCIGFFIICRVRSLGYLCLSIIGLLIGLGLVFSISHIYMLLDASGSNGHACKMVSQMTFMPDFWYDFFHERYAFVPCNQVKSTFLGLGFPWWALLVYLIAAVPYSAVIIFYMYQHWKCDWINNVNRSKVIQWAQYLFLCGLVLFFCVWFAVSIYFVAVQRSILYRPDRYGNTHEEVFKKVDQMSYELGLLKQKAYVYPFGSLSQKKPPRNLWIVLSGRDSLALDGLEGKGSWLFIFDRLVSEGVQFLLIDYPGFGLNEGFPTERFNRDSVLRAYDKWRDRLNLSPEDQVNVYIVAHSMGTGIAVDAALLMPDIKGVVLLSPFVSIFQMSKSLLGAWMAWTVRPFLLDRYPTAYRLSLLHEKLPNTGVAIFHGDKDVVVPVSQSQSMVASNQWIQYYEISGASHSKREFLGEGMLKVMREMMSQS
ncbi:MAG: alpha/beta fold hydrolase [Pseudomonadota bacterium]|nr:alpha/beta fold hydrolase [Pseudomonadota bacterium]